VDSEFARQYYESAKRDHWWFRGRELLVAELVNAYGTGGGVFLDLGAGVESLLPSEIPVVKLDLVVPDGVRGPFVRGSAESLPFRTGELGGVGLFDVLEHLDDPRKCLEETKRVTRPGGLVMITVPAHRWLWSRHDEVVGHKRRYSSSTLRGALEDVGLSIAWMSAFYGFLLAPALARRVLSLESPMTMPGPSVNRALSALSQRSVRSALGKPSGFGLSLAAVAFVP